MPSGIREYGRANLISVDNNDPLFTGIKEGTQVWMSHADTIATLPSGYKITGSTADVKAGAFHINGEKTWGIQFHPEVYHTTEGTQILKNFVVGICGCSQNWTPDSFVGSTVDNSEKAIG